MNPPPARRRTALGDATLRANEGHHHRTRAPRHGDKLSPLEIPLPHNESLEANGTLSVRHPMPPASPQHKRLSAVVDECRPHNPKRDSQVSNASTTASNASRRKSHVGPWNLGKTIGRGGCSRVRVVRHSTTGQYGAAKIISKATADKVRALSLMNLVASAENDPAMFSGGKMIPIGLEREICIMKLLDHPHIVRLYDIWENRNEIYLIMEYIEGGELFGYIGEKGCLPEELVVHLFRQIIAALMYCHRINIHHRDLKPENILLDRDTMTIKLVDFGMAALQPMGKKLTTPCGSPHYAAPEVIKTKPYDGGQADVWSCGVILFVLLTGTPPFNYSGEERDLAMLFYTISKADYQMPRGLSIEAMDLIRKILIPDPRKRITLNQVWNHPFMRKYEPNHKESMRKEYWIGPEPSLDEWMPLEVSTIDRDILRYMRTLWHSEAESTLLSRLLDKHMNAEKYFYTALQKYQQDQLENFTPQQNIVYSNSDHHHHKRIAPSKQDMCQLPSQKHMRSQSGYSILNNEHLYSKHSFYDDPPPPSSEASYDPFRASRDPIVPSSSVHQNITVHRGTSNGSRSRSLRPSTALGHHTRGALRVQAMTRNSKQGSVISRTSKRSTPSSNRSMVSARRSISRSSLVSSHPPSSPPVFRSQQSMHKRGVSFSHLRRGASAATASTAEALHYTPEHRKCLGSGRDSVASSSMYPSPLSPRPGTVASSSPAVQPAPKISAVPPPRLKVRKPESPSKYIQSEVRKVSTELGKVMEEAFNRSSICSSVNTSVANKSEYDTPPTSLSNRDSGGTSDEKIVFHNRPLPPIPDETPQSFLKRRLAETREEMALRFEQNGGNKKHLADVYRQLDVFMEPKRVASAPTKPSDPCSPGPLHVIPEEGKDGEDRFDPYSLSRRAVTDPVRPKVQGRRALTEQNSIRLVHQSPTRVEPLNIRKRSVPADLNKTANEVQWANVDAHQEKQASLVARTNQETPTSSTSEVPEKTIKKKKSSWFRRNPEEKNPQVTQRKSMTDLDDRAQFGHKSSGPSPVGGRSAHVTKASDGDISSEFPMRRCGTASGKSEGGALKGLFNFFGKKSKDKNKQGLEFKEGFSTSSVWSDLIDSDSGEPARPTEYYSNWLSRFLHIKPASKALCFRVTRARARKELLRLLHEWECRGVRDVALSPDDKNVINVRVDKNNYLKLKPVNLVIELFAICDNGRRTNLCCARFTQTRGAASSFRKTVDIVEDVCANKGMLVESADVKENMLNVLGA